jgi:hypothetical protein
MGERMKRFIVVAFKPIGRTLGVLAVTDTVEAAREVVRRVIETQTLWRDVTICASIDEFHDFGMKHDENYPSNWSMEFI